MNTIEKHFLELLKKKKPDNLYRAIQYVLMQSGKRIRPQLVQYAIELFDGDAEQAQYLAEAFEMLHNFTLIHDDIMDAAPLRRGQATVYKKWNNNIAILAGDALANMALQQLLKINCPPQTILNIAKLFLQTSIEICEGQQYDLDFETQETVTMPEYIEMIRLKTAVMFAGCLKAGAILANADETSCRALYDFGIHLGIAFQLEDDVLDVYADAPAFGKTIGGDIRDNKKTYLYLKALELANPTQKQTLINLFSTPTTCFETKYNTVKQIFDKLQIRQITMRVITNYVEQGLNDLQVVSVAESKKEKIKQLAFDLMHRNK